MNFLEKLKKANAKLEKASELALCGWNVLINFNINMTPIGNIHTDVYVATFDAIFGGIRNFAFALLL